MKNDSVTFDTKERDEYKEIKEESKQISYYISYYSTSKE